MLPHRAMGDTMLVDPDEGDRVVIRGTVTDIEGQPIEGAVLDCWQNATAGFYAVQQPDEQTPENLRGIYTTGADGTYEIRTVRPVPYPIPSDGPVGDMLKANKRNWMRPGHTHMWVRAGGYKDLITHVFDEQSDYLRRRRRVRRPPQPHPPLPARRHRRARHHLRHRPRPGLTPSPRALGQFTGCGDGEPTQRWGRGRVRVRRSPGW